MITWRKVEVKYGPWPEVGYVGTIEIFRIVHTKLSPEKTKPYLLFNWLPTEAGNRDRQDEYAATVKELKQTAEKIFMEWLGKTGLRLE